MLLKALLALTLALTAAPAAEYIDSLTGKNETGVFAGWETLSGNWKQTESFLAGSSSGGDGLLLYKKKVFTDFILECKVRVESREGSLVFRAVDRQNLYILVFNPKVNPEDQGSILLIRRVKGRETYFAGSEQYIRLKEWVTLKVACEGKKIEIYVNGNLTVSVEDPNFESGFVGLRVFGDFFYGCNAGFKDFLVKAAEEKKK